MVTISVSVMACEDPQESELAASIQLEESGPEYVLATCEDRMHEISAETVRQFVQTWRETAARIGASFDPDDTLSYADEIEEEG